MIKNKQLKNKNNKGEMKSNTVSRSVRMRDYNQNIIKAINNFATQMTSYTKNVANNINVRRMLNIIAEILERDVSGIAYTQKFDEDLGADSLDTVELVTAFEREFSIDIPDSDVEKLQTVGDVVNYTISKTS
jgi:acyl carrier protein